MIGTALRATYVVNDNPTDAPKTLVWDLWKFGMDVAMLNYQNSLGLNPRVTVISVTTELEN